MALWDLILKICTYVFSGIGGTVAAVGAIAVGAYFLWRHLTRSNYDVFLAVPMAAASPQEVDALRILAQELVTIFQSELNLHRVYCAWLRLKEQEEAPSKSNSNNLTDAGGIWDPAQFALPDIRNALKNSTYFVLVYPEKRVSSVLVEAGMALSFKKPSVWFVKDEEDLPFLMRNGEGAANRDGIPNIKVYVVKELRHIKSLLRDHKRKIFGIDTLSRFLILLGMEQR